MAQSRFNALLRHLGDWLLPFLAKKVETTTKNKGMKIRSMNVAESMPPVTAVPMAFIAPAPAPVAMASGSVPKKKASEVMMTGRKRIFTAARVASTSPLSLPLLLLDELNDQDGVLGRKPERRQESDLEVDVVGQSSQGSGRQSAEHAQRQHQEVDERDGPAFIQRGDAKEDHQDGKSIEQRALGRRHAFLVGEPGPVVAEAFGQLSDDFFHGLHGLAGTSARRRLGPECSATGKPL